MARAAVLILATIAACVPFASCSSGVGGRYVTVSNPAMGFFVSRLLPADVAVNVMIPQGADHDSYTPKPSQMASLAGSEAYIAFGPLEFETTWRERILSSAPSLHWVEVSSGISLITSDDCLHHDAHHSAADPHFWLSPRQAAIMVGNLADSLKVIFPAYSSFVDSSLVSLKSDIASADSAFAQAAESNPGQTFVIYHPALAYLARDYGFRQLCVGGDGIAPSPRRFAALADSAKAAGARVFFLQEGFAPDRVKASAADMGVRVVKFQPESANWIETMDIVSNALR